MNDDSTQALIAEIESSRFASVRMRQGYDMLAVDEFLDRLIADLKAGRDVAKPLSEARFPLTRGESYDVAAVDEFLATLLQRAGAPLRGDTPNAGSDRGPRLGSGASLEAHGGPDSRPVVESSPVVENSPVVEKQRSLWERLTGKGKDSAGSW
ncbi:MAG: DivIVA domain-containing protein [Nocardioides sp.]